MVLRTFMGGCKWLNARMDSLITGIRLGSTWFWVHWAICLWKAMSWGVGSCPRAAASS